MKIIHIVTIFRHAQQLLILVYLTKFLLAMLTRIIAFTICVFFAFSTNAQYLLSPLKNDIKDLPHVEVVILDSSLAQQKLNMAFTTLDSKIATWQPISDPASFQIVSATNPYPPKVFALANLTQFKAGKAYLLQDFRNHTRNYSSIYVNFTDSVGPNIDGYLIMKKDTHGRYMVVDSFINSDTHSVDAHSFVVDKNGYYWYLTYQYHPFDMSYRTSDPKDTGAAILTTKVGVWDPATSKSVFELDLWEKGLLQIDSIPMSIIEKDTAHLTYDVSHANSWVPVGDMDGCPVGALSDLMDGIKFIRLCDGTVMRYGATNPDFKALDNADHHLYLQHDFKLITEGPYKGDYSCFNDCSGPKYSYQCATVPILKFDFKNKTVQMVHEYTFPEIYSVGRGSVDFSGDYMLINFGVEKSKVEGVKKDIHYRDSIPNWIIKNVITDKVLARYYLSTVDHAYNVWFMKDDQIARPRVIRKGNELSIDSTVWSNPLWSNGATSDSITPDKDGNYFVSVNGGSIFRLVSDETWFSAKGK